MAEMEAGRDQRTEEATPRKREEAREKGQVAISTELIASVMLIVAVGTMMVGGGRFADSLGGMITSSLEALGEKGTEELTVKGAAGLVDGTLRSALLGFAPFFGSLLAVGFLVGYGQVGFRLSPKAVSADLGKLNPIKGLGRIFSARGFMRTVMALLKILAIATTMVVIAWSQVDHIVQLGPSELGPLLRGLGHIAIRCTAGALLAVLALAVIDFVFQRFQQDRDLRMTKQEVKEEHKNTEGDPHVKSRIRQIQREMATRRMMAEVPSATVVVTNPTHYAVALRYDHGEDGAPVQAAPTCVAKGADAVALKIREIAEENDVVCYEDVALARALHAQVEVGEEIPEDLYAAVAVVLTYVYRLQGRAA